MTRLLHKLQEIHLVAGGRFILMHGTLIGEARNGETVPFDVDVDVDILEEDTIKLEAYLADFPRRPGVRWAFAHDDIDPNNGTVLPGDFVMYSWPFDKAHCRKGDCGSAEHLQYRLMDMSSRFFVGVLTVVRAKASAPQHLPYAYGKR